jgi:hypothetical protein
MVCYDPPLIFLVVLIFWKDKVCEKKNEFFGGLK